MPELTKAAHDTIRDYLGKMVKSTRDLTVSHQRLHKALDTVQECHKLHALAHKTALSTGRVAANDNLDKACGLLKAAHESARLEGLKHKSNHAAHVDTVTDAMTGIIKVLSGGSERAGDTTSAGSITALASRLSTSNAAEANKAANGRVFKNAQSPFGLLEKAGVVEKAADSQRRVSPHERNSHFTG